MEEDLGFSVGVLGMIGLRVETLKGMCRYTCLSEVGLHPRPDYTIFIYTIYLVYIGILHFWPALHSLAEADKDNDLTDAQTHSRWPSYHTS